MTLEMQHTLDREMEDARRIEDPARRLDATLTVLVHQCRALVECQQKTAERVKALVAEVAEERQKRVAAAEAKRNRVAGAKMLWAALRYLAAAGSGAAVVRALCASA